MIPSKGGKIGDSELGFELELQKSSMNSSRFVICTKCPAQNCSVQLGKKKSVSVTTDIRKFIIERLSSSDFIEIYRQQEMKQYYLFMINILPDCGNIGRLQLQLHIHISISVLCPPDIKGDNSDFAMRFNLYAAKISICYLCILHQDRVRFY